MKMPNEFFAALYRNVPDNYIAEIRMIANDGGIPIRMYRPANYLKNGNFEAIEEYNKTHHIYHRVALSLERKSRKQDIAMTTAIWMDIDGKSDDVYQKIENHHYPPTMLIDSGGGWHCYWLLKEPLILASDKDRHELERTIQGLILDFGDLSADKHVKDCTRILRTPFFYNIKEKYAPNYPQARIVWYDDSQGDRYKFEWLHKRFAPLGAPEQPIVRRSLPVINDGSRPKWILDYFATGAGEGSRNQRLFVVARWFCDVGNKSAEAEQDLISRALADGLSQSEAVATIRSAWSQAPNASASVPRHMKRIMGIEDTE